MKKIIAILLLLAMSFSLYACEEKPNDSTTDNDTTIKDNTDQNTDDTEESKTITLTKENFFDYFAIQLEYEDLKLEQVSSDTHHTYHDSVCELEVKVDSITDKTPNNVSITLTVSPKSSSAYGTSITDKKITIPANGSYSFKQLIRTKGTQTLTNYSGVILQPIAPLMNDFVCTVSNVTGTLS